MVPLTHKLDIPFPTGFSGKLFDAVVLDSFIKIINVFCCLVNNYYSSYYGHHENPQSNTTTNQHVLASYNMTVGVKSV